MATDTQRLRAYECLLVVLQDDDFKGYLLNVREEATIRGIPLAQEQWYTAILVEGGWTVTKRTENLTGDCVKLNLRIGES